MKSRISCCLNMSIGKKNKNSCFSNQLIKKLNDDCKSKLPPVSRFPCPGVDFIKVGRKAQIIEIDLLKLGARRKARSTPVKSFSKVGRRAKIGCKKFMKSTPGL